MRKRRIGPVLLRFLLPLVLGVAATGAMPPLGFFPLLLPAFTGLLILIGRAPRGRDAFWLGWWFGLGHFATGLYWISNALLIDSARFWWLVPFAVLGLPAVLGIFTGVVAAATRALKLPGALKPLVFAALWVLAEYARGHLLTGFPWNLTAYAWSDVPTMLQTASWFGAYGLSFLTVLIAGMPACLVPDPVDGLDDQPASAGDAAAAFATMGAFFLLMVLNIAGWARLPQGDTALVPGVKLRLVQANIPQSLKWRAGAAGDHFSRHLELSSRPGLGEVTAVIWPETALPFLIQEQPEVRAAIRRAVPPGGLLLTGAVRVQRDAQGNVEQAWNSLLAIDDQGEVKQTYDKAHLVPFGEYVPFRGILPVDKVVPGAFDFSAGPGPRTLTLPGLPPVSPIICYEAIFPDDVTADPDAQHPVPARWLLNVTNDGWYGYSAGPFQHFAIAAMRAVEEGIPLVRAANTGISGVVDPYGRVIGQIGLEEEGIIDLPLPEAASNPTLYSRLGDAPVMGVAFLLLLLGLVKGQMRPARRP